MGLQLLGVLFGERSFPEAPLSPVNAIPEIREYLVGGGVIFREATDDVVNVYAYDDIDPPLGIEREDREVEIHLDKAEVGQG
jgi:hypothetical protein